MGKIRCRVRDRDWGQYFYHQACGLFEQPGLWGLITSHDGKGCWIHLFAY